MQGMGNFKIPDPQQAKMINNFKNIKQKLLKTSVGIWFSKICRVNQLTPKHTQIKLKHNDKQIKNTGTCKNVVTLF